MVPVRHITIDVRLSRPITVLITLHHRRLPTIYIQSSFYINLHPAYHLHIVFDMHWALYIVHLTDRSKNGPKSQTCGTIDRWVSAFGGLDLSRCPLWQVPQQFQVTIVTDRGSLSIARGRVESWECQMLSRPDASKKLQSAIAQCNKNHRWSSRQINWWSKIECEWMKCEYNM